MDLQDLHKQEIDRKKSVVVRYIEATKRRYREVLRQIKSLIVAGIAFGVVMGCNTPALAGKQFAPAERYRSDTTVAALCLKKVVHDWQIVKGTNPWSDKFTTCTWTDVGDGYAVIKCTGGTVASGDRARVSFLGTAPSGRAEVVRAKWYSDAACLTYEGPGTPVPYIDPTANGNLNVVVGHGAREWDDDTNTWVFLHHPFTMPLDEDLDRLESDPGSVRAKSYDVVVNGVELGSGSVRIHKQDVQNRIFRMLGISEEEAQLKFEHLLSNLQYGAPPHGGFALGLDRIAMLISGASSIRDVTAFPKTQKSFCPLTECPGLVDQKQLDELGIKLTTE